LAWSVDRWRFCELPMPLTMEPITSLLPKTQVTRRRFAALFLSVLAVSTFASASQQILSPNHSRVLLVDTSGRRDIIYIKSGSKTIRLFYGNAGDALDDWKPGLSKLYGIPESQIGKIVLPSFVAAKWFSENEVQVDLESSFTETKNFDSFEFSVRALVGSDGTTLRTAFLRGPTAQ